MDNTIDYINLRNRRNWEQVGQYLYSWCVWGSVIDNSAYGHGFAMYHELLGCLANGWSWDRSVLRSSGIKSHIVNTCNKIYDLINPEGGDFWQYAYNVLYDTRELARLKTFADEHGIALLLVHHTRKREDVSDPFNCINGTNRLLGTVDTALMFQKPKRADEKNILSIVGRDVSCDGMVV